MSVLYPCVREEYKNSIRSKRFNCNVCGRKARSSLTNPKNLRETIKCQYCNCNNRQRQIIKVLLDHLNNLYKSGFNNLTTLPKLDLSIYNCENNGPLHNSLKSAIKDDKYYSSEYIGPQYASGEVVNGIRNEDIQDLSFHNSSLDCIISTEVLEHVPNPYKAFSEIYRVLKPNGRHIFTVPFDHNGFLDDQRAQIKNSQIVHLKHPIYHKDPIKPEGILVYTIFSLEMIIKLAKIGFHTKVHRIYNPDLGIYGNNGFVFESIKK